jgi:hypothetical protein
VGSADSIRLFYHPEGRFPATTPGEGRGKRQGRHGPQMAGFALPGAQRGPDVAPCPTSHGLRRERGLFNTAVLYYPSGQQPITSDKTSNASCLDIWLLNRLPSKMLEGGSCRSHSQKEGGVSHVRAGGSMRWEYGAA